MKDKKTIDVITTDVQAFDYCLRHEREIINKITGTPFHIVKRETGLFLISDSGKRFIIIIHNDRIYFIDYDNHKGAWLE